MARPQRVSPGRILAAAAIEFAARGYAGARVDRIARRARVNKAMLYYHFRSKQGLYRTLLRQTFTHAGERLRAIAASNQSPGDQLDRVIATIAEFIQEHEYFPAIMLREVAERGAHLDPETLATLSEVPRTVAAIITRGVDEGVFRPVHPMAAYFSMLAPIVFFLAGAPIRRQLAARHLMTARALTAEDFVAHVQEAMRCALAREARPSV
jgi:TetR/AcrR family transcriptional regulator